LLGSHFQSWLLRGSHPAQQGKELTVQFANSSFIDQEAALVYIGLDFDELPMVVVVLPANERQHLKAGGAMGQTERQHAAGVVGGAGVGAGRIVTAMALASHEDRTVEGLHVRLDVPRIAMQKRLPTMQARFAVARDNQSTSVGKKSQWAMTGLRHDVPPPLTDMYRHMLPDPVTIRQPGGVSGNS